MQAIVVFLPSTQQFGLINFAKSTVIANLPVASGRIQYFAKDEFIANASEIVNSSIAGYPTRQFSNTELEECVGGPEQFLGNCSMSLLITAFPAKGYINVRDQKTGDLICKCDYPLKDNVLEMVLRDSTDPTASTLKS